LELKLLKTGMIVVFINVNSMGSHNGCTLLMYLHIINTGLRMVWWSRNM